MEVKVGRYLTDGQPNHPICERQTETVANPTHHDGLGTSPDAQHCFLFAVTLRAPFNT